MPTWLEDANGETWRPVRGFSDSYAVSNLGRVKSLDRWNINRNGVRRLLLGRLLKLSVDGEGYPQVGLLKSGKEVKARVHRLVAETFIPNLGGLPIADHIDRNRKNNTVSNLRWASFSQNRQNITPREAALADMKKRAGVE